MKKIVALFALSFAVACSPSANQIVTEFETAINTKNSEQLTALFADSIKVTANGKTTEGKDAVKKMFEELFTMGIKSELVGQPTLEGTKLTWMSKSTSMGMEKLGLTSLEAKNEGMLENGKFTSFTWELTPEAMTKYTAAMAEMNKKLAMDLNKMWNEKNLDGFLAMFGETATVTSTMATWTGLAQLKEGFTAWSAQNTTWTPGEFMVEGDKIVWTSKVANDEFKNLKLDMLEAKNELVLENGKVKSFSTMLTAEASKKLQEASATAQATPAKKGKK